MKTKPLAFKNTMLISLIFVANLSFLYYLKYASHSLEFKDFSIHLIGNSINGMISFLIVFGIIIVYIKKRSIPLNVIYLLTGLLNLFLILSVLITSLKIPSREYYLLSLSFVQVLIIVAFGLFQFTELLLMFVIWFKIMKLEKLIYLRAFVNIIFLGVCLLIFTLIFINIKPGANKGITLGQYKPSIAAVLGAAVWSDNKPSPSLAARVDKAAELFKKGVVSKIQLTGSNAPGELSEAEVSLIYVLKNGIKRDDVWIEKKTTSTIEQIKFIKKNLIQEKHFNTVIIISDAFHLQRVKEICKFYNINVEVAASDLNLKTDKIIFYQLRESIALILFWLFAL